MNRNRQAFTLAEVLVAVTLLGMVLTITLTVYIWQQRAWQTTALQIEAAHAANIALNRVVYGIGAQRGLRAASDIALTSSGADWDMEYTTPTESSRVEYRAGVQQLIFQPGNRVIGRGITAASVSGQGDRSWVLEVTAQRERGRSRALFTAATEVRQRN